MVRVYEISFRESFDSSFWFASAPIVRSGDRRYSGAAAIDYLRRETAGQRVLVLIHGYNNSVEDAQRSYSVVESNVESWGYGAVLRVFWPAHTAPGFWFATGAADKAGRLLGSLLRTLSYFRVDFEAHSLGNRVLMEALRAGVPYVGAAILTAPAIDDESIVNPNQYYDVTATAEHLLVCYSRSDKVLGVWYRRFGSLLTNLWSRGDVALGFSGPENIDLCRPHVDVLEAPLKDQVDHSGWKNYAPLYDAWHGLFRRLG